MTLPEIVLPKVELPFDVALLLHPSVVHFVVALPIVILLLELMNLMLKKKAVGGVSFFLLLLTIFASVAAYFTGLVDGKEAFASLGEAAKAELSEHKLLGTYLMLGTAVLLFLKLLAMTGNKVLKALYIFGLIGFVVVMFKQGKEGGELVYEHGLNVKAVQLLDDKIFDLEEALEEAKERSAAQPVPQEKTIEVVTPVGTEASTEATPALPTLDVTPEAQAASTEAVQEAEVSQQQAEESVAAPTAILPTPEQTHTVE